MYVQTQKLVDEIVPGKPDLCAASAFLEGLGGQFGETRTTRTDLMTRVAMGDSAALGTLYDHYGAAVYSLALRMLHDHPLAEELVQETFVRVWRQSPAFDEARGAATTWIMGIARHLAIDELRRRAARPSVADGDAGARLELVESGDDDPSEQAYARIRHDVVTDALARLPAAQRTALELAYFGGLSQREIAARLGDPLGTVKTRIRLGLEKLKSILSPSGIGAEA